MRLHITLEDALVRELDSRLGRRGRSAFITALIRQALVDERRWDQITTALGTISDTGHEWDDDPAGWVAAQRADPQRIG